MNHSLEEVYQRVEQNKKEIRELNKMIKDELTQIERHREILDELKALREEKKAIENEVKANSQSELTRMEDLKLEVATDKEILSDLALNKYVANETVEIMDEYDNRWVPIFSVTFKKDS